MSAIAQRDGIIGPVATTGSLSRPWTVSLTTLDAIEAEWRALELNGHITPYQQFAWIKAYGEHVLPEDRAQMKIVTVREPSARLLAILPFAVRHSGGIKTAMFIGGKHANFHMGVFARGAMASLDERAARQILQEAAGALGGIDAFILTSQPVTWDGHRNPFAALDAQASPSHAYKLALLPDCAATLQQAMSSHARKKHKNKRARFAELGPSRMFVADTTEAKTRVLAAFLRQKASRFDDMGIPDPFADAGVQAFLRSAGGLEGGHGALQFAGLELNGALVATYIGAIAQGRFSGMATSFEPDPAVMKVSPGEILLVDLIRHHCGIGMTSFDLGIGEARYKASICNQTEELADSFIGISARGKLAAQVFRSFQSLKGALKRSPLLYRASQGLNRLRQPFRLRASAVQD